MFDADRVPFGHYTMNPELKLGLLLQLLLWFADWPAALVDGDVMYAQGPHVDAGTSRIDTFNEEIQRLTRQIQAVRTWLDLDRIDALQKMQSKLEAVTNVQSNFLQRITARLNNLEGRLKELQQQKEANNRRSTQPSSTVNPWKNPQFPASTRPGEHLSLKERQKKHQVRPISHDEVSTLSSLSDRSHFKDVILKPILTVRPPGSAENEKVQQHIKGYLENLGWSIHLDSFRDATPLEEKPYVQFTNIIATFQPNAPRKLTLACHFDSKYFTDFEFIGATDSAVPCAMLLDLARTLDKYLKQGNGIGAWDVTLQFIFFDGEEAFVNWTPTDSIYGARHLAKQMHDKMLNVGRNEWVKEIETMDVMILLDLIGAKDPIFRNWFSNTQHNFKHLSDIEMRLAQSGHLEPADSFKKRSYNKYFPYTSALGGGIQDDHIPFLNKNVPIVHMIAYPFPREWHTKDDNEKVIDYTVVDNLNKILRVFVAEYLHLNIQ